MSPKRYHPMLRVLHWLIAALIIAALIMGTFVMAPMSNAAPEKRFILLKHMLAGLMVLGLTLLRRSIRSKTRRPAPMYSGIAAADRIVPIVHRIFDAMVFIMIGSGLTVAILAHVPTSVLTGNGALPETFASIPLHSLHVFMARLLAATVSLHVSGAFYHQFILKDGLMSRMSLATNKR